MIQSPLADFSNLAIVAAIAVFMMAFIAYSVDLIKGTAERSDGRLAHKQESERVAAHEGGGSVATKVRVSEDASVPAEGSANSLTALTFAHGLAAVGTVLQLLGVIMRGIATERVPWSNMYEFTMTGAGVVMLMFLMLSTRVKELRHLGVFILGPMLVLMLVAQTFWFLPAAQLTPSLQNSHWLVIHVIVAVLAISLFSIGAVVCVLQIFQNRGEGGAKVPEFFTKLPSSQKLEGLSFQIHGVGFVLWTFTLITGAIWANYSWGRPWGWDPKEVWTFVIWVVYAAYLHARATRGFRGNRAAYFALAGFASVIFNYTVVNTVINGLHSYSGL